MSKMRVAVIFGGRSGEHEVSLMSAESVMGALDLERFEPIPIGITKDGEWFEGPNVLSALKAFAALDKPVTNWDERKKWMSDYGVQPIDPAFLPLFAPGNPHASGDVQKLKEISDVVFPVLHGPYGEDGTVQALFELSGIPYVGSGVTASAVGMDKVFMRTVFRDTGLPVVDDLVIMRRDWVARPEDVKQRIAQRIGFPCFVKPANLGSSVGISKVDDMSKLGPALDEGARYDRKLIVEQAIVGYSEVECGVLGNDEPEASVVGEIVPTRTFYDYEAKYHDESSKLIVPARLSPQLADHVRDLSIHAFRAIDGAGLARVDFFANPDSEDVIINEINTMPGFTRISMYPKLWEASGLSYKQLITRLIELAFDAYNDKNFVLP